MSVQVQTCGQGKPSDSAALPFVEGGKEHQSASWRMLDSLESARLMYIRSLIWVLLDIIFCKLGLSMCSHDVSLRLVG